MTRCVLILFGSHECVWDGAAWSCPSGPAFADMLNAHAEACDSQHGAVEEFANRCLVAAGIEEYAEIVDASDTRDRGADVVEEKESA